MVSDYRLTTSLPALGSSPLPSSQVGQYISQQVVGAQNASDEAKRNAFQPQSFLTQNNRDDNSVSVSNTTDTVGTAAKNISDSNKRLFATAQQAGAARKAAQTAASGGSTGGSSSSGGSYGSNTYTVPVGVTGNRAQALRLASGYLGTRYVLGGTSTSGIDCSGLVMQVYNQLGYNVSRHSATWQRDNIPGVRTNNLNSLQPGDLVAWKDGSHIAIYAGNGEIIEAANEQRGTLRRKLWASPSAVVGIKLRFPGE